VPVFIEDGTGRLFFIDAAQLRGSANTWFGKHLDAVDGRQAGQD